MLEIYLLSMLLYILLGFVYTEYVWNDPKMQDIILEMRAFEMPEDINLKLAFVKLMFVVFWPLMVVGTLFYPILKRLGIIEEEED